MLTFTLYAVACEPNVVDKTDYIDSQAAVSGTVRGDLFVQRPTIEIEGDASDYNYMSIGDRYYHILSCDLKRTGLSVLQLQLDPLWTFKDAIYELPAVVDRSYRLVNSYLPDSEQKAVQYTYCVNKNIGSPLDYVATVGGADFNYHVLVTVG